MHKCEETGSVKNLHVFSYNSVENNALVHERDAEDQRMLIAWFAGIMHFKRSTRRILKTVLAVHTYKDSVDIRIEAIMGAC